MKDKKPTITFMTSTTTAIELPRRDWIYAMTAKDFQVGPCPRCGGMDLVWSTARHRVWCNKCAADVIPECWGVIDGPVPIETCRLLGIVFDSIDLHCMQIVPFNSETWPYSPLFPSAKNMNESSSPTAGGGSGGAQPKGTNEK